MKPRMSMITPGVRDLGAAIEFYEHGLGVPRMESPPEELRSSPLMERGLVCMDERRWRMGLHNKAIDGDEE